MKTCSVEECSGVVIARGWCSKHYQRWMHNGDPLAGKPSPTVVQDDEQGNRRCTACLQWLPIANFDLDAAGKGGRRGHCKACRSARMKAWYLANQERQSGRQRDRFTTNREAIRKQDMERYERHKDKRLALVIEHGHVRRARMLGVAYEKGITVRALQKRDGDLCCYCKMPMCFTADKRGDRRNPLRATIEHALAVSRGGTHTWDNVSLACWQCNVRKNATDLEQWLERGLGA